MTKPNMDLKKTPMPQLSPEVRARCFDEVAQGYSDAEAQNEAARCLNCKNPACVGGCPVGVKIPNFIAKLREGDIEGAFGIISADSSLPAVCGRVCPQESQCEARCVRGIKGEPVGIGRLERYVADRHAAAGVKAERSASNGVRVAVVGSGPSGLTCAGDLARAGFDVTVFEALHTPGGVLMYGIPEFRLPKSIVAREVDSLRALGVEFMTNIVIGKTLTVDDLFEDGYRAVYIGSGAGLPMFMGIPGEGLCGVYSANEYLTRANLMGAYKENSNTPIMRGGKVAVVGGGNVAMDAARTALRLGAERVMIIYRRSEAELPARREEVEHAKEEGVEFHFLCNPIEVLGYETEDRRDTKFGFVRALRCVKMELGEPDERGRRRPRAVEGSEFELEADTVIMALGTTPNPLIRSTTEGLEVNARGCIIVDEASGRTTRDGVYAGGDAVTGAATVISAMGAGKHAARAITESLKRDNAVSKNP